LNTIGSASTQRIWRWINADNPPEWCDFVDLPAAQPQLRHFLDAKFKAHTLITRVFVEKSMLELHEDREWVKTLRKTKIKYILG
jgi:hypothetical protein